VIAHQAGDVGKAFNAAARRFTGVYVTDHVYHATMEPMNALASVKPDSVELWVPTQSPTLTMLTAAALTKLPPTAVKVNTTQLGGGFGRRLETDFVADAVLLSKEMGRPVKVIWSREDDVKNDKMRPLTAQYLEAATDDLGDRRLPGPGEPREPQRESVQVFSSKWMPHSSLSESAHRPARSSSSGRVGRVHGMQPIER